MAIKIPRGKKDKGFGGKAGVIVGLYGNENDRYVVYIHPIAIDGRKVLCLSPSSIYSDYRLKLLTDKETIIKIISGEQVEVESFNDEYYSEKEWKRSKN